MALVLQFNIGAEWARLILSGVFIHSLRLLSCFLLSYSAQFSLLVVSRSAINSEAPFSILE